MNEDDDYDDGTMLDELVSFCRSNSISLKGLREIFERYGITLANDSCNINDYKFFFCACHNEHVDEAIIQCLIEYFPDAASAINVHGETPLVYACRKKYVTASIIRLLIKAHPSACQLVDNGGNTPLHHFCFNQFVNGSEGIEILKLLLKDCSSTTRHFNNEGRLPIQFASFSQSPEFCSILIDAYPGSEQICDQDGSLPFHFAIRFNDIATVEYLYKIYPEAMNCIVTCSSITYSPIFRAILRFDDDYDFQRGTADIVRFVLNCDPNASFEKFFDDYSLLGIAFLFIGRDSCNIDIDEGIRVIQAIYDAHPELINDNELHCSLSVRFYRGHPRIQTFLNGEFVYASQAKDHRTMVTPDENGQLPLHIALQNNASLGSIKLLIEGNPSAIREGDHNSVIPLNLACEHHDSPEVIEYLVGLDSSLLQCEDIDGNTALHYACRGAKYATITLLLDKFDAVSVSRKNRHSKLPIDLLLESDAVEDRESAEYTDGIFRLLRAHPDTMLDKAI